MAIIFFNPTSKVWSQNLSCKDFRTGQFELRNKESNKRYVILRGKDFQLEQTFDLTTNKKIKKDTSYKIKWRTDCDYNLLIDDRKNVMDDFNKYTNAKGGLNCSVKKIDGKCFLIETKFEGDAYTSKICKVGT